MKGREAIRSAQRREREAQEEIARLKREMAEERDQHRRVVTNMRAEVVAADARTANEVKELSEARVREIERECDERIAEEKAKRTERAQKIGEIIESHKIAMPDTAWVQIMDALQVKPADLGDTLRSNRTARRADRRKILSETNSANSVAVIWRGKDC